jgi:hypothetical protein
MVNDNDNDEEICLTEKVQDLVDSVAMTIVFDELDRLDCIASRERVRWYFSAWILERRRND